MIRVIGADKARFERKTQASLCSGDKQCRASDRGAEPEVTIEIENSTWQNDFEIRVMYSVIPGRCKAASPESRAMGRVYGFRVRHLRGRLGMTQPPYGRFHGIAPRGAIDRTSHALPGMRRRNARRAACSIRVPEIGPVACLPSPNARLLSRRASNAMSTMPGGGICDRWTDGLDTRGLGGGGQGARRDGCRHRGRGDRALLGR